MFLNAKMKFSLWHQKSGQWRNKKAYSITKKNFRLNHKQKHKFPYHNCDKRKINYFTVKCSINISFHFMVMIYFQGVCWLIIFQIFPHLSKTKDFIFHWLWIYPFFVLFINSRYFLVYWWFIPMFDSYKLF